MRMTIFTILFLLGTGPGVFGQLTIEECYRKVRDNYPLVKQYGLIEQAEIYNLSNANKGYLPQFSLSAKVSYQSAVTEIPVKLPGLEIEGADKDQYQTMAELNQTIWDGGVIRSRKRITEAETEVEKQKLGVDMYTLNERVNQLFFGILLLEEQLKQNSLLQADLKRNYEQVASYITNGIANQADLDVVKVNQLTAQQRETELKSGRKSYREMLSAMAGVNIGEGVLLVRPEVTSVTGTEIDRPELQFFGAQRNVLELREKMLVSKNLPRLGMFVQGGYSNPGLNMLKNEFSPYYIAGIRLSWDFSGLYTRKNERRLLENEQGGLNIRKETFLFNTGLQMTQENREVEKIRKLMKNDDEIILLRTNIRKAAEVKVANGTLSATELLREVNAEDLARQNKVLHGIQLLMAVYDLKNTMNQ